MTMLCLTVTKDLGVVLQHWLTSDVITQGLSQVTLVSCILLLQELNSLKPNEGFRLWMTAETHPKFPTILLQSSLKITYEVCCIMTLPQLDAQGSSGPNTVS